MKTKYIMKSHKPNLQKEEWVYDLFDNEYLHVTSVTLKPEHAKDLGLKSISPMELHNATTTKRSA